MMEEKPPRSNCEFTLIRECSSSSACKLGRAYDLNCKFIKLHKQPQAGELATPRDNPVSRSLC